MKWLRSIVLFIAVSLLAAGCNDIKNVNNISIASCGVKYITPTGLRSLSGVLLLEIDNPSFHFTVSDVEGCVKFSERKMIEFTAGEIPVQKHSCQVYELPCTASLADKVSYLDIMAIAAKSSYEGLTADVDLRVTLKSGVGTTLHFKDIDLSQISQ